MRSSPAPTRVRTASVRCSPPIAPAGERAWPHSPTPGTDSRCVTAACRQGRPATERELLVLRTHLQASLLADEREDALPGAIAAHERLGRNGVRPGDPDRSRELRRRGGWAWTRLFRRYDDYARALERLGEPVPDSGTAPREHAAV